MNTRWFVLTAAACALVVPVVIVAAGNQDLTDGPAVQDAIVNFGHGATATGASERLPGPHSRSR